MKRTLHTAALATLLILTAGCGAQNQNEMAGAAIGAITGAVVGNQFGSGSGRDAMIVLGTFVGTLAGSAVGRHLDQESTNRASQATTNALQTNQDIAWENPSNASGPARGQVQIVRSGHDRTTGSVCREYRHKVIIGDAEEELVGTACRQADGTWKTS